MCLISKESIIKVVSSDQHKSVVSDGMSQIEENQTQDKPIVKKQKTNNKTETNLSQTLSRSEDQRKLQYIVEYNENVFTISIESSRKNATELRKIVETIQKNIDSEINLISHMFEVSLYLFYFVIYLNCVLKIYSKKNRQWYPKSKTTQLVSNMSPIRVKAKDIFHCFVDIYVQNEKMFEFEVKKKLTKYKNRFKRTAICNQCIINGRRLESNFNFLVNLNTF